MTKIPELNAASALIATVSAETPAEEDIPMVGVTWLLLCRSEEGLNSRLIYHLQILIVKEEPVAVALYETHITFMIRPTSHMDYHSKQRIFCVCIFYRIDELKLKRGHDSVGQLPVVAQMFDVVKPLEMDHKDLVGLLDLHPLLGFLLAATRKWSDTELSWDALDKTKEDITLIVTYFTCVYIRLL